jgi:GT2 family glycosyltransferase/2-polyprenyl-3-methyl-5-hydroxy-6-metoxy-1,4-benzoquinol methylase/glycosyltransferase involved in cell wall biosynthesis
MPVAQQPTATALFMHLYHREILDDAIDSLSLIASLIQPGQNLLDLGMGSGALGRFLRDHKGTVSDGVTLNEQEAALAADAYRQTVVTDLDTADLSVLFPHQRYDGIVCADVFEHLKSPERLLTQLPPLLSPGGRLISSIPNAAYGGLIAELLAGEFKYRPEGLLDETHLRFFTLCSIQRWLARHGWQLEAVHRIVRPLSESEFKQRIDALPPAVASYLVTRPDAWVYQYVVVAVPAAGAEGAQPVGIEPITETGGADFVTQLYWAATGRFDEAQKLVACGRIGEHDQELVFPLKGSALQGISALKLDPADRTGYLHLHQMRLCERTGRTLWCWQGQHPQDVLDALGWPHNDILMSPASAAQGGLRLLVHGPDPAIDLPIPEHVLQLLGGQETELRVRVGWPLSADYMAMAPAVDELVAQKDGLIAQKALEIQALRESSRNESAALQSSLQQTHHLIDGLRNDLRQASEETTRLGMERQQLQQHVNTLEGLLVFRLTRPLARLKQRVSQAFTARAPVSTPLFAQAALPLAVEQRKPVDIIVPVYRGLDDTRRCLESLVGCRYAMPVRVLVINDHSPEAALVEWLTAFAQQSHPVPVELIHNPENLGFVATVNKGMALHPQHDVVLFNSDAQAANNWLDRLQSAALRGPRIATATPFSNNATICSYPRFCEESELPPGETTASMDALCEQYLSGLSVEIPTAHGFCMYIRREVLDRVGLFDVENFGKGYGEENDFCQRAQQAGWSHVHALDVFVRHAGGISFGSSKALAVERGMNTLRRLYPHYEKTIHDYVRRDPAAGARRVLDFARILGRRKTVVLNITHNREGGTLRHQRELSQALGDQVLFLQLRPCPEGGALSLCGPHEELDWHFELPQRLGELVSLLKQLRVAHIHVHHLLGQPDVVWQLPALLGVRYDVTIHDYYFYCPQISLTDQQDRYCGEKGLEQCRTCLSRRPAPGGRTIEQWHQQYLPLLEQARYVICPTEGCAERIRRFVPLAPLVVCPHLDLDVHDIPPPHHPGRLTDRPLRVVVIGAMAKIKGADVLESTAIRAFQTQANVEFHLLGYAYRSLQTPPGTRLTVHGPYDDAQLPRLLEELTPDIVWFPAVWPETYAYTLSACLDAGLPIMASDIGAFSDRLRHRALTWLHPWDSTPQQWLDHLLLAGDALQQPEVSMPAPDTATGPSAAAPQQWRYERDYVAIDAAPQEDATELTPAHLRQMVTQFMAHPGLNVTRQKAGLGHGLVDLLYRVRAAPQLSWLARCVPTHTQRRVKSWLIGLRGL